MSASFLVPFTLHVKISEDCEAIHEHLTPLLTLLSREDMTGRLRSESLAAGSSPPHHSPNALGAPSALPSRGLSELLAPLPANVPVDNVSISTSSRDFVAGVREFSQCERGYVRLVFREYCDRKGVEKDWQSGFSAHLSAWTRWRAAELSPAARASLSALREAESDARAAVCVAYDRFVAFAEAAGSASARRREAIAMITREEDAAESLLVERIDALRQRESLLVERIAANARRRAAEQSERMEHIDAEEQMLRQRMAERERQAAVAAQREEAQRRSELMEHIDAEEQMLREKMADRERRREDLYEHVRAEEQLLRQRVEQRRAEAERHTREMEAALQRERDQLLESLTKQTCALHSRLQHREEAEGTRREEELRRQQVELERRIHMQEQQRQQERKWQREQERQQRQQREREMHMEHPMQMQQPHVPMQMQPHYYDPMTLPKQQQQQMDPMTSNGHPGWHMAPPYGADPHMHQQPPPPPQHYTTPYLSHIAGDPQGFAPHQ